MTVQQMRPEISFTATEKDEKQIANQVGQYAQRKGLNKKRAWAELVIKGLETEGINQD